jgi:hypothetical protein
MPRLRMRRGTPPLRHTPSWLTQGQLYTVCIETFKITNRNSKERLIILMQMESVITQGNKQLTARRV